MDSSHFGVYQQTLVDSSEISIRTFVPGAISTEPYHKELDTPFASLNDLMKTVASYFDINTGSAESEDKATITSVRELYFYVSKLQGVGFSDVSEKALRQGWSQ